jgi:hypothetical protein
MYEAILKDDRHQFRQLLISAVKFNSKLQRSPPEELSFAKALWFMSMPEILFREGPIAAFEVAMVSW